MLCFGLFFIKLSWSQKSLGIALVLNFLEKKNTWELNFIIILIFSGYYSLKNSLEIRLMLDFAKTIFDFIIRKFSVSLGPLIS
jgi:hypothetical protein